MGAVEAERVGAVQLTVIGSGVSTGAANESSPGYLVTSGHATLLLECGPGIATRIQQYVALDKIVGVAISHMHFDNFYDLLTLAIVLYNAKVDLLAWKDEGAVPLVAHTPLPVYLPPEGAEHLRHIMVVVGANSPPTLAVFETMLALHEYAPYAPFAVGPFRVTAIGPVAHGPGLCFGLRLVDAETTIGYSGESGWCDALHDVSRETDLFLCDAVGITGQIRTGQQSRHLSADEAGHLAARTGTKHLVLTHIVDRSEGWRDAMTRAARKYYWGPISIAHAGNLFTVVPSSPSAPPLPETPPAL